MYNDNYGSWFSGANSYIILKKNTYNTQFALLTNSNL